MIQGLLRLFRLVQKGSDEREALGKPLPALNQELM